MSCTFHRCVSCRPTSRNGWTKIPTSPELACWDNFSPEPPRLVCQRDPVPCGLSCFVQDLSTAGFPWSSEPDHIRRALQAQTRLCKHWLETKPLRMIDMPYESFVGGGESAQRELIDRLGLIGIQRARTSTNQEAGAPPPVPTPKCSSPCTLRPTKPEKNGASVWSCSVEPERNPGPRRLRWRSGLDSSAHRTTRRSSAASTGRALPRSCGKTRRIEHHWKQALQIVPGCPEATCGLGELVWTKVISRLH